MSDLDPAQAECLQRCFSSPERWILYRPGNVINGDEEKWAYDYGLVISSGRISNGDGTYSPGFFAMYPMGREDGEATLPNGNVINLGSYFDELADRFPSSPGDKPRPETVEALEKYIAKRRERLNQPPRKPEDPFE